MKLDLSTHEGIIEFEKAVAAKPAPEFFDKVEGGVNKDLLTYKLPTGDTHLTAGHIAFQGDFDQPRVEPPKPHIPYAD
jgi:hypothetical protein